MKRLVYTIFFNTPDMSDKRFGIDADYAKEKLKEFVNNGGLNGYILQ